MQRLRDWVGCTRPMWCEFIKQFFVCVVALRRSFRTTVLKDRISIWNFCICLNKKNGNKLHDDLLWSDIRWTRTFIRDPAWMTPMWWSDIRTYKTLEIRAGILMRSLLLSALCKSSPLMRTGRTKQMKLYHFAERQCISWQLDTKIQEFVGEMAFYPSSLQLLVARSKNKVQICK